MLEKDKQMLDKDIAALDDIKARLLFELDEDEEFTESQGMKLCSAASFITLSICQLRELILCDSPPQNNIN